MSFLTDTMWNKHEAPAEKFSATEAQSRQPGPRRHHNFPGFGVVADATSRWRYTGKRDQPVSV